MKKRIVSLVLLVAFLGVLSQGSVFGMNARAESLKLSSYNGWYSTAKAANLTQIRKVSNLSASQTSSEFSGKVEDLLFTATYRPTDIGGKDADCSQSIHADDKNEGYTFPCSEREGGRKVSRERSPQPIVY